MATISEARTWQHTCLSCIIQAQHKHAQLARAKELAHDARNGGPHVEARPTG